MYLFNHQDFFLFLEVAPVLTKITDKTDNDVIEVIESGIEVVPSSRSRTSKPKKCVIDSDSDSGGKG